MEETKSTVEEIMFDTFTNEDILTDPVCEESDTIMVEEASDNFLDENQECVLSNSNGINMLACIPEESNEDLDKDTSSLRDVEDDDKMLIDIDEIKIESQSADLPSTSAFPSTPPYITNTSYENSAWEMPDFKFDSFL